MLILKHFDPKKADLIFTEEGSVYQHCFIKGLCMLTTYSSVDSLMARGDDWFSNLERVVLPTSRSIS